MTRMEIACTGCGKLVPVDAELAEMAKDTDAAFCAECSADDALVQRFARAKLAQTPGATSIRVYKIERLVASAPGQPGADLQCARCGAKAPHMTPPSTTGGDRLICPRCTAKMAGGSLSTRHLALLLRTAMSYAMHAPSMSHGWGIAQVIRALRDYLNGHGVALRRFLAVEVKRSDLPWLGRLLGMYWEQLLAEARPETGEGIAMARTRHLFTLVAMAILHALRGGAAVADIAEAVRACRYGLPPEQVEMFRGLILTEVTIVRDAASQRSPDDDQAWIQLAADLGRDDRATPPAPEPQPKPPSDDVVVH